MSERLNRRTVLSGAGSAFLVPLAGCADAVWGTTEENDHSCEPQSDADVADNDPGEDFPTISVESDESQLEHTNIAVEVVRHFDADGPARLRITFTNTYREARTFEFGPIQPFSDVSGTHVSRDASLLLHPGAHRGFGMEDDVPEAPENGCWQIPDTMVAVSDLLTTPELAPCESLSREYDLYAFLGETCLAEGEYRFEDHGVGEIGYEWGFSVFLSHDD